MMNISDTFSPFFAPFEDVNFFDALQPKLTWEEAFRHGAFVPILPGDPPYNPEAAARWQAQQETEVGFLTGFDPLCAPLEGLAGESSNDASSGYEITLPDLDASAFPPAITTPIESFSSPTTSVASSPSTSSFNLSFTSGASSSSVYSTPPLSPMAHNAPTPVNTIIPPVALTLPIAPILPAQPIFPAHPIFPPRSILPARPILPVPATQSYIPTNPVPSAIPKRVRGYISYLPPGMTSLPARTVQCRWPGCTARFLNTLKALNAHFFEAHGLRGHAGGVCEWATCPRRGETINAELRVHVAQHEDVHIRAVCDVCSGIFSRADYRNKHRKTCKRRPADADLWRPVLVGGMGPVRTQRGTMRAAPY